MTAVAEQIRDFAIDNGDWHGTREELTGEVPLLNNVLDSVGLVELVSLIEHDFGIEVGADDLEPANFATIDTVVAFILRRQGG